MNSSSTLSIQASFDLICPWCLIGKRHLDSALEQMRQERPDLAIELEWQSFPLIPDTPLVGLPYRDFYVRRLGSPEAVASRQAQVRAAAQQAGLDLALTSIETFPNTLLAHRLVRFARLEAGAKAAAALIDNLFTRYFLRAENIGDGHVLRQALMECGIPTPRPADAAVSHETEWLPPLRDLQDPSFRSGGGVPYFVFNGTHAVSGAHPPATLVEAMRLALAE